MTARRLPLLRRSSLRFIAPLAGVVVLLGAGGLAAVETETVRGYGDALLWALSLMTTVGFVGGIPHSIGGRLPGGGAQATGRREPIAVAFHITVSRCHKGNATFIAPVHPATAVCSHETMTTSVIQVGRHPQP